MAEIKYVAILLYLYYFFGNSYIHYKSIKCDLISIWGVLSFSEGNWTVTPLQANRQIQVTVLLNQICACNLPCTVDHSGQCLALQLAINLCPCSIQWTVQKTWWGKLMNSILNIHKLSTKLHVTIKQITCIKWAYLNS